jgi:hypothetical protein
MNTAARVILLEGSVLADLHECNLPGLLGVLAHTGQLRIATPALQEASLLTVEEAGALGLAAVEPSVEIMRQAAEHRGRLSASERITVLLARAHAWTCMTCDAAFATVCAAQEVSFMSPFEALAEAVLGKHLPLDEATRAAHLLLRANPRASASAGLPAVLQVVVARKRAR